MRYLSKIIFINSADKSIKYAEVDLDGNVHFIGTQGVGKSTLLRAILFFYNADTQKLGIPREKKNYGEYYFPFQNSFIIYEIHTETGRFCVATFKNQGRVAFRFIDAPFQKNFFIDSEGKAFDSWDKTREALGKNIGSSRIITSYEEYRNILYGNNKGLSSEYRKYALLESKQFQNIPRTIANVFLNTKLDAEFVKETIIQSLNEDEIKIDLTTYSQTHLRDFETNLNDIKKWTDKNRIGENQLEKLAIKVSTTYSAFRYLELQKKNLAFQLGFALNHVKASQPTTQELLAKGKTKHAKLIEKLKELDGVFDKRKAKIIEDIGAYTSKLKETKNKREEYAIIEIEKIMARVSKKINLEIEKGNLETEIGILTSKFTEIQHRYDAQLKQLENQLVAFENNKHFEKNKANAAFLNFKDDTNKQYELIFDEIRKLHQEQIDAAHNTIKGLEAATGNQQLRATELKYKRFFDKEIENCKTEYAHNLNSTTTAENQKTQAAEKVKNIQREWELEELKIKELTARTIERHTENNQILNQKIKEIDAKIENSKNSLFAWLNENMPNWENNIGKVIDEENVLFLQGLNPQKINANETSFFGIKIDTSEITKNVKTVADLKQDKEDLLFKTQTIQQTISLVNVQYQEDTEKLKKKYRPKIKEQKEIIDNSQYVIVQNKTKADEIGVRLLDWENKAVVEQKKQMEAVALALGKLQEDKLMAEGQLNKILVGIQKTIDTKKKEKESKLKIEQQKETDILRSIDEEIATEKIQISQKIAQIKKKQIDELNSKGADTKQIGEIELRLKEITAELGFIENNRDKVADYNKDKRELFDREDEFKNTKRTLEKQLETEAEKHQQQNEGLRLQIEEQKLEIETTNKTLASFQADLDAFENFTKTDVSKTTDQYVSSFGHEHQTDLTCTQLINELQSTHNTLTTRYIDLQEAINKFTGNFQENNLFSFKVKLSERSDFFEFAEMLKEFIEENKIDEYKLRLEERFAGIIRQIGKETQSLIEKEGEISKVIAEINNDFIARNFVGAIKSMELKTDKSANSIFLLLLEIKTFNDANVYSLGKMDLFSSNKQAENNQKAIELLKQLVKEMAESKEKEITLSDSFELWFKIVENDNDTGWVEKLTNVGSEGTDVLVKAMINIMLLNVFKEKASRKNKDDFRMHCMMDEIGKLHPTNVKGILKFANDRNILLINSSPTSYNAMDYRYTYLLSKDPKNITTVKRLVKSNAISETKPTAK